MRAYLLTSLARSMTLQPENYFWIFSPKIWHRLCYYQFQSESAVTSLFTLNIFFFPWSKLDILLQNQQNHNRGIIQKISWKHSWFVNPRIDDSYIFCLQEGIYVWTRNRARAPWIFATRIWSKVPRRRALGKFQNHPLLCNILKHCVVRGFASSR